MKLTRQPSRGAFARALFACAWLGVTTSCGSEASLPRPPAATNLPVALAAPDLAESRPIVVTVTSNREIEVGGRIRSCELRDREALRADLARLSKGLREEDRALLVRADASTPYGVIQAILDASSAIEIRRWSLEVTHESGGSTRAFEAELPLWHGAESMPVDEDGNAVVAGGCNVGAVGATQPPHILLWWNAQAERFERLFEETSAGGLADDEALEARLRAVGRGEDERGSPRQPVLIECSALVSWQHVIDVANVARRADWPVVRLAFGIELEEMRPDGVETR